MNQFRLFDFNIPKVNEDRDSEISEDSDGSKENKDTKIFRIQMFGINEKGETASIMVDNYHPFFYVKLHNSWSEKDKSGFVHHIKKKIGEFYAKNIVSSKLVRRHKLYGFDNKKEHVFLELKFKNIETYNKVKYLWYRKGKIVNYEYNKTFLELYECQIPPLLRYFHIQNISPSGWIEIPKKYNTLDYKSTTCNYEYLVEHDEIVPLNDKETPVPYKICSFDIEASSSHGDFPIPKKSYKKLATNIVDFINNTKLSKHHLKTELLEMIKTAFGYSKKYKNDIQIVYPKERISLSDLQIKYNLWISTIVDKEYETTYEDVTKYFNVDDDEDNYTSKLTSSSTYNNIFELLSDANNTYENKINQLNQTMKIFPSLEGDKVTYIGSTFMKYGDKEPYKNHCIVLNDCDKILDGKTEIVECKTEKDLLVKWTKMIQEENPDIIIGYNIFGFDYEFLFQRSLENKCHYEFLQLSRNIDEPCFETTSNGEVKIEESKIVLASGEHNLKFIKMNGRVQIDLYNYFRRDFNLPSYKLDYVASYFISDDVTDVKHVKLGERYYTDIYTKNMTGLYVGSFINFEESSHSTEYYKDGAKFEIVKINKDKKCFRIEDIEKINKNKKFRWGLAKDDVSPKDIFELANGSSSDRSIIAKYCIQDCNLVQYLLNKIDVITGFIEMAKICSVPINFLVMRGQGIKLTSFIAKECRKKNTLMPVLDKKMYDDGYEGAIVLNPKCDLYLDNPVACVDYASLYPSSMISENLSHDSKVWSKEFDLNGNLLRVEGEEDDDGNFIYDNLPGFKYIDITYDVYSYRRSGPTKAAVRTKVGIKTCRWAQYPEGKAIMPSILEELLAARKATRKLIKTETDDFMKNILDKRQLSYKLTANSLYGQCGAKTSTFYEKDVAASTTATGRTLLIYAKELVEQTYGNVIVDTSKYGKVHSNAEYVYGDTDSVFFTFNLKTLEGENIRGKKALEITIELAKQVGELASKFLKAPHDLEYEKTFMPFALLSKKRYVGMLYEEDPDKCTQKSMGIVLKRRDNAPIVKDVYGGIIDILMKDKDIQKSVEFLKSCLQCMIEEKYPIEKLIITKSLRSNYKNPRQIAHKVLADRMGDRDPGNKPSSGDRIPFAYIKKNGKCLQGERIEHPNFIRDNDLKLDYEFYITNQIMKPVQQVFALVLDKIPAFTSQMLKYNKYNKQIKEWKKTLSDDQCEKKIEDFKNKNVKELLFDEYINKANKKVSIMNYFN
jgi:DNA polymerase elongation subunit (family B)